MRNLPTPVRYLFCLASLTFTFGSEGLAKKITEAHQLGAKPQEIGAQGVAWYTTWESAKAEAERSNRPIFFMSGATQCGETSGIFCPGYTKTENTLFSDERFIKLSKRFVCIRLATLENSQNNEMVQSLMGKFSNTSFVIFAPDGETKLTKIGKSPRMVFGDRYPIAQLRNIAKKFEPVAENEPPLIQNFYSFKQALLTSSADQRLLVYTVASPQEIEKVSKVLRSVAGHDDVMGRFHFDQWDELDLDWFDSVSAEAKTVGHLIIRPGAFGLRGELLDHLPLNANVNDLGNALLKANESYAQNETRKIYQDHLAAGNAQGIKFENHWIKGVHEKRAVRRGAETL